MYSTHSYNSRGKSKGESGYVTSESTCSQATIQANDQCDVSVRELRTQLEHYKKLTQKLVSENGPKLVKAEEKQVTTDRKLVTENGQQGEVNEKCPGSKKDGKETEKKEQKTIEKAMVDIIGHTIHYKMSGGAFYLEKATVLAMLNSKKNSGAGKEIARERIGNVEFVSLKSLESAVRYSAKTYEDVAFKPSLLSRDERIT